MSIDVCNHEDVEANVMVIRLFENEETKDVGDPNRFVAEVQIRCADCQKFFGFRAVDTGLLPDRPTMSPDRIELRAPLISPTELELYQSISVETTETVVPVLIEPDIDDLEKWYKIQSFDKWYGVRGCCRNCATQKFLEFTSTRIILANTYELPDWLIRLPE